jgi:hypothetical protein
MLVRRRLSALSLAAATLAGLAACATPDGGMQEKFYDATRAYNRALRWGDFDRAAEYVPAAAVDAFLDQHDAVADKLVILDYQLTRLELDRKTGKAGSRVEVRWHTDDRLVVETTVVDQQWQFYEGGWWLVDERRARGKPLAIFAEAGRAEEPGEAGPALPHPYLPGLDEFRDARDIGLSPAEKRKRDRARRRARRLDDAHGSVAEGPARGSPGT